MKNLLRTLWFAALTGAAAHACAGSPAEFLSRFVDQAREVENAFAASPARGEAFFTRTHGGQWSCSSCHTEDPAAEGRHASTGKAIAPMAPARNPERLASPRQVEKWFRRNCKDVLERECSPAEKADVVAYLMSIGR